jgi:archaemetzincin
MILTIKPFGTVDPTVLAQLQRELTAFGTVVVAPGASVPDSFVRRRRSRYVQVQASDFEAALAAERGDRVLAVTDVDLFDRGLNFVFGHATLHDRFAVISLARFGDDGQDKLVERAAKTAIHELGHTFGLYHDDANPECVMHFSERIEDTDRKGRAFCERCAPAAAFTLSRLGT